jgi:hypothetical protein
MSLSAQRLLYFTWLVLALGLSGCSAAEAPRVLSVTQPAAFRPRGPQEVKTLQQALSAIITVSTENMQLPPVEPLYLELYKDTKAYTSYTGRLAGLQENRAQLTFALPHENRLHINLENVRGQSWGALLRVLAHEYGHNVEYVLGAGRSTRRWLSEGFAEWVAAKVMDSLGWESYASSLRRAELELSRYEYEPPRLAELESDAGWARVSAQPKGRIATYDLAFYAFNKLIEKKGAAAVMDYFASKDFASAFAVAPDDFDRALGADLEAIYNATAPRGGRFLGQRPEWKTGYQWRYALRAPGLKAALVANEVVREDFFADDPVYVLAAGKNEYPHDKASLAVLGALSGGTTVSKNNPPSLTLDWPLDIGKRWENDYVLHDLEHKRNEKIETEIIVGDFEIIRVPAGTFPSFRVETYASPGGELISEQWYAPEVKWFVKSKFYREDGVIEQDLVAFKLD